MRHALAILLVGLATELLGASVFAQPPKAPPKSLGVDSIRTTQKLLYGFVLSQKPNGAVECAIDRKWLTATHPELAAQIVEKEKKTQLEVKQKTLDRIQAWITNCVEDKTIRLKLFLEDELNRIQGIEPEECQSVFVLLNLSATEVSKITLAKADQRHIAGVAYKHEIPDVTTTATSALEKRLKEMNVDAKSETFDLTGKLPTLIRESDDQWSARQALIEHGIVESFELQGKGDSLMAAGDPIDPTALLKEFSSAQNELLRDLAKELKLDLGPGFEVKDKESWKSVAIKKAQQKKFRGVLVHRLEQRLGSSTVKVKTDFLAQNSNGDWITVYHAETSNDGSGVSKEELERLQQDPNLKQILPMVEAMGGQAQLEQALRQGAATAVALGDARKAFQEFKLPHTRSLTSPPIPLPGNKP